MWDVARLADDLRDVLWAAEQELRVEQAVYGLDARDERQLQGLLADGLSSRYAVAREAHYPSSRGRKLSHRPRCDLVLCPSGRPLAPEAPTPHTLFDLPPLGATPAALSTPREAMWLEVKVACQFRAGGVQHGGYGAQWRQNVIADLRKMEADPLIREAGLVLIVFNESREILEKDLELLEDVLALKEVLAGFRHVRSVPVLDRIGHRICSVAIWPTIQR